MLVTIPKPPPPPVETTPETIEIEFIELPLSGLSVDQAAISLSAACIRYHRQDSQLFVEPSNLERASQLLEGEAAKLADACANEEQLNWTYGRNFARR